MSSYLIHKSAGLQNAPIAGKNSQGNSKSAFLKKRLGKASKSPRRNNQMFSILVRKNECRWTRQLSTNATNDRL